MCCHSGRLWYGESNAVSNAVDYAKFRRSITSRCDSRLRFRFPKSNNSAHFAVQSDPSVVPGGALLSRGVSIKGSVKFLNELLLEGEVEGTIVSTGTLTIGEQARVRGEIRTKSVNVRGTVEGNIFVTERCELHANCTVRGDIEAPRLVVSENDIPWQRKGRGREVTPDLTFVCRGGRRLAMRAVCFSKRDGF